MFGFSMREFEGGNKKGILTARYYLCEYKKQDTCPAFDVATAMPCLVLAKSLPPPLQTTCDNTLFCFVTLCSEYA